MARTNLLRNDNLRHHYPVCRNALQTSLIRELIRRRISSTINCEIQIRVLLRTLQIAVVKRGWYQLARLDRDCLRRICKRKVTKNSSFQALPSSKILQTNRFLSINQLHFSTKSSPTSARWCRDWGCVIVLRLLYHEYDFFLACEGFL